jgi:hypothetical protein
MNNPLLIPPVSNQIRLQATPAAAAIVPPATSSPAKTEEDPARQNAIAGDDPAMVVEQAFAAVSQAEALMLSLSPPQRTAIELLTSGKTLATAATAAGVSRMTLYRWLKADAAFSAAYNAWQKDILDTARARLLALSDLAVTTVAKSMALGNAQVAMKVLQSIGAMDHPEPGSTDPDEILRMQKLERLRAQTALRKAESRAEMEAEMPL